MITHELDSDACQVLQVARELDLAIEVLEHVIAHLERHTHATRSVRYVARLRTQLTARENDLAELHRMRSRLRARFGV